MTRSNRYLCVALMFSTAATVTGLVPSLGMVWLGFGFIMISIALILIAIQFSRADRARRAAQWHPSRGPRR